MLLSECLLELKKLPSSVVITNIINLLEAYSVEGADTNKLAKSLQDAIAGALAVDSGLLDPTRRLIEETGLALTREHSLIQSSFPMAPGGPSSMIQQQDDEYHLPLHPPREDKEGAEAAFNENEPGEQVEENEGRVVVAARRNKDDVVVDFQYLLLQMNPDQQRMVFQQLLQLNPALSAVPVNVPRPLAGYHPRVMPAAIAQDDLQERKEQPNLDLSDIRGFASLNTAAIAAMGVAYSSFFFASKKNKSFPDYLNPKPALRDAEAKEDDHYVIPSSPRNFCMLLSKFFDYFQLVSNIENAMSPEVMSVGFLLAMTIALSDLRNVYSYFSEAQDNQNERDLQRVRPIGMRLFQRIPDLEVIEDEVEIRSIPSQRPCFS